MADELFDTERLRRNWAPLPEELAPGPHPVLEGVGAAEDPLRQAHEVLERLERLAGLRFPTRRETLAPFFREARELLAAQLERPQVEPLLAAQATLDRLEELLEVFTLEQARGGQARGG